MNVRNGEDTRRRPYPTDRAGRADWHAANHDARLAKFLAPQPWRHQAACADHPAGFDIFFPEKGRTASAAEAKTVCAGCPVKAECLAYALTVPIERHGVWGGTTVKERRSMARIQAVR